MDRVSSVEGRL